MKERGLGREGAIEGLDKYLWRPSLEVSPFENSERFATIVS